MEIIDKLIKESKSKINIRNWNEWSDTITETLDGARESEEFETIKERVGLLIDSCLKDYNEEEFKDEDERLAFIRLRDIAKKY